MSIINQISGNYCFKESGDYIIFNSSFILDEFINLKLNNGTIVTKIKFEIRYQIDNPNDRSYFMTNGDYENVIICKDDISKTSYTVLKVIMNAILNQRLKEIA